MKHLGDITKLNGAEIPVVDVITGGSPCQDLSVAGKRAGLKHESHGDDETTRSGLFMDQIRLVKEMREHDRTLGRTGESVRPRYMVWENVPGAFSSNGGKDFQAVLEEIIKVSEPDAPGVPLPEAGKWSKSGCIYDELGRWSLAWRVHDAQFFGVLQRRRRIALLADFGGTTAPWIMFEPQLERETPDSHPYETESGSGAESRSEVQPLGESVSGDSYSCRAPGEEAAGGSRAGSEGAGAGNCLNPWDIQSKRVIDPNGVADARSIGYQDEVSPTLRGGEGGNQKPCVMEVREAIPIENHPNDSRCKFSDDGVVQTLSGRMGTGGNNTPLVMERRFSDVRVSEKDVSPTLESGAGEGGNTLPMVLAFDTTQITSPSNWSHPKPGDPCHPLASTAHPPAVAYGLDQQGGKGGANYSEEVCPPILSDSHGTPHAVAYTQNQREEVRNLDDTVPTCIGNGQGNIASHISEEMSQTLNCMHDQLAVMTAVDCRNGTENEEVNGTLQAKEQGQNLNSNNVARTGNTVRRLTPLECERLQAFPDGWTNIGEWVDSKGKTHKDADTPRYKALGNSIALPFWDWLLGRISAQYDRPATLGSLFDGIGGFPLCWEKYNGKGSALWASEIEDFPIAVTKLRFPENEQDAD